MDEIQRPTGIWVRFNEDRGAGPDGLAPGSALADAVYGTDVAFRDGITALGLDYVVGVQGTAMVCPPGTTPKVPAS